MLNIFNDIISIFSINDFEIIHCINNNHEFSNPIDQTDNSLINNLTFYIRPTSMIYCPICLEYSTYYYINSCNHTFCTPCFNNWSIASRRLHARVTCPLCRQ